MTNLIASKIKKKRKFITPENALIFIPVFLGVFVSGLLISTIVIPLNYRVSEEKSQIEVLKNKILLIPIYKNYIKELSYTRNKANKQQQRLIQLISDPNELKTLLSEINTISLKYGLKIIDIKAKPIEKRLLTKNDSFNAQPTIQETRNDPFLIQAIEKHSFRITVSGNYMSILNFLKELELLQTISITDSIELESVIRDRRKKTFSQSMNLKMEFDLSTYSNVK